MPQGEYSPILVVNRHIRSDKARGFDWDSEGHSPLVAVRNRGNFNFSPMSREMSLNGNTPRESDEVRQVKLRACSCAMQSALQVDWWHRQTNWTYHQYVRVRRLSRARVAQIAILVLMFAACGPALAVKCVQGGGLASEGAVAGKVTQYTKYNKHGQVLESIDPNGVVTTNSYDLRQRLLITSAGGQTISYTYDPVGQLTRVTQPDASYIGYEYDAAHRRKVVLDNRSNRIDYTLDNAGTRIAENVKDPGGALRRTMSRSIDALGRVQQTTGRE